jgi:hypothetical protein
MNRLPIQSQSDPGDECDYRAMLSPETRKRLDVRDELNKTKGGEIEIDLERTSSGA